MCSFGSCQTRFEFLSQFRKVGNAFECFVTQVQTRLPKTKCVWPMKINVICTVHPVNLKLLNAYQFDIWYNKLLNCHSKWSVPFFCIPQVNILPPRGLYHPVRPYRSGGKLTFPLCCRCTDNLSQEDCTCTDEQRTLLGTWCGYCLFFQ